MASKKKRGAFGPASHWLDLSIEQRAKTKQYIKEGLQGYERSDGVRIPGARRIYKGLTSSEGFDLRHVERWTAAKLAMARDRIQSLNTLTGRPFQIVIPRSKKQRIAAQKFTGQNLSYQKEFIVTVQDQKKDTVVFRNNQVAIERKFPSGTKSIKQRYLFRDYLERGESTPITFQSMRAITQRMLPDMPERYYGSKAYYTILTVQFGPVGASVFKERVLDELSYYHSTYGVDSAHKNFAEQVIGFQMVGTFAQASAYERLREEAKANRKRMKKLRFNKRMEERFKRTRK